MTWRGRIVRLRFKNTSLQLRAMIPTFAAKCWPMQRWSGPRRAQAWLRPLQHGTPSLRLMPISARCSFFRRPPQILTRAASAAARYSPSACSNQRPLAATGSSGNRRRCDPGVCPKDCTTGRRHLTGTRGSVEALPPPRQSPHFLNQPVRQTSGAAGSGITPSTRSTLVASQFGSCRLMRREMT